MQVFHQLGGIPQDFGPTVLSVGNFDGVHRAHALVLREVVQRARELGARALAVTFEPHPTRILRPHLAPPLITPLPAKLRLLEATGLDAVLVLPFTRDLSLMPPREFAEQVLGKTLRAREVHEGSNFHFGHQAEGNVERLAEYGSAAGFEVRIYPELRMRGRSVSSSTIRELVRSGNVVLARRLLGRPFSITALPGRGRGFGLRYTVPTINLSRYDELVPLDGVYVTRTGVAGECFDSVTNVGNRPTFGADSFAIETHLLNFHEIELAPDAEVEITFLRRLRPEIKFPSIDALREQIARDVHAARRYFRLLRPAAASGAAE
jgi:riboflavin kinase/FMN adenylyltransferase